MSKKDYIALATALAAQKPYYLPFEQETDALAQWKEDCLAIANVCAEQSPIFDRARFLAACKAD